jgi:hypothetical protein
MERETGLDYAISLAETSAYTLPRPLSLGRMQARMPATVILVVKSSPEIHRNGNVIRIRVSGPVF